MNSSKLVVYQTWNGKIDSITVFVKGMIDCKNMRGFGIILSKKTASLPSDWEWEQLDPNNPTSNKKKKAESLKTNALAMEVLTLACTMSSAQRKHQCFWDETDNSWIARRRVHSWHCLWSHGKTLAIKWGEKRQEKQEKVQWQQKSSFPC